MSRSAVWLAIAVVGGCADEERDPDVSFGIISEGDAGVATEAGGPENQSAPMPCPFPAPPTPTGPWLHVVAGRLSNCEAGDGPALDARFCGINALELVGETLYVSETTRVRALDLPSGMVRTVTSDPLPDYITYADFTDLASDDDGYLYVNDSSYSLIHQLDPVTGEMTIVVDLAPYVDADTGIGAHANAIISDRQEGLWVADFNAKALRHVDIASAEVELVLSTPVQTMVVDSDGELYFTSSFSSHSIIQWLDQRGPTAVPLFDTEQVYGEGATRFQNIEAATLDLDGMMWVSASEDRLGLGIHLAGNVRTAERVDFTIPLESAPQNRFLPAIGTASDFVFDTSGDILVGTETQIHRVDPVSGSTTTIAGTGCEPQPLTGGENGVGSEASFDSPWDLATDGEIAYVINTGNDTIRRIDLSTNEVTSLAAAKRSYHIALADDGNLYTTTLDGLVYRVDNNAHELSLLAGGLGSIEAVASDGNGHLYLARNGLEALEYTLLRVTLATGEVSTVTGLVDPNGDPVQFYEIGGLVSDGQGNLYIGDFRTLRRLTIADGVVTDLVGERANGGVDGGSAFSFNTFSDLAFDGSNALYAASSNMVLKIDLSTLEVTTEVGGADVPGVRPGPLPGGVFNPRGLAVLPSGDLLMVDSATDVILRADFDGPD